MKNGKDGIHTVHRYIKPFQVPRNISHNVDQAIKAKTLDHDRELNFLPVHSQNYDKKPKIKVKISKRDK